MQEPTPAPFRQVTENGRSRNGADVTYSARLEDEDLLSYCWRVLVKYWLLVILVFLPVVGLAAYMTFTTVPLYTATTTLRIEPQNPTVMKIEEVLSPQAASGQQYDYYQTQFVVLKSRTLAARVITDLGLEWNPAFTGDRVSDPGLFDWLFSQLSSWLTLLRTSKKASSPVRAFELRADPSFIDQYLTCLQVTPLRNTRLVQIAFTTPDSRLSQEMANAHAAAFIHMNLETRFDLTTEAQEFLEKKLAELKLKVEQSEAVFNQFRQKQRVVSLQGNENIIVERMVDLNKRLTKARTKRIEAESLYRVIQNKDPQHLSRAIDNSLIQQLKSQITTLETEYVRLSVTFEPAYPRLVELTRQITETRQRLDREIADIVRRIEADYAAARAIEGALQTEAERQQQAALNLKARGAEYVLLEGAVESNRSLYDSVLKRANETNLSGEIAVSNIQVIDRAETPRIPSSPQKRNALLKAAFLGLLMGAGLAFFLEYLNASVIKTPKDIWRAAAVPTLGVVPHLSSLRHRVYSYGRLPGRSPTRWLAYSSVRTDQAFSRELTVSHHPFSILAESYRGIRTALLLSQAEKPPQVILLTSAHPGEGKTVTTLNLAIALAQDGHEVLVIDADLRKGGCHRLLGQKNHWGLSNVLTDRSPLKNAVQPTTLSRISFLSRGEVPPNPAELLGSRKMREILDTVRERFAFILLDAPPVLGVSDAVVLSALCDGVLLVVRGQETAVAAVAQTIEQLKAVHAKILGAVLNGADLRNPDYASYRYYYTSYYAAAEEEKLT